MEFLSYSLIVVGCLGWYVGYFWSLRLAFCKSGVHGVACVLVPMLLFYFLMTSLKQTWRPVLVLTCSVAALCAGWIC